MGASLFGCSVELGGESVKDGVNGEQWREKKEKKDIEERVNGWRGETGGGLIEACAIQIGEAGVIMREVGVRFVPCPWAFVTRQIHPGSRVCAGGPAARSGAALRPAGCCCC